MKDRTKKSIYFFLFLFLICGFVLQFGTESVFAASGVSAVAQAEKNKLSGGRWVTNEQGIRYKTASGTYVKSAWGSENGGVFYFDASGYVKRKAFTCEGESYYADSKGKILIRKLKKRGGNIYYYGSDGAMLKGQWHSMNGKKYYFNRVGVMVTSSWIGNSYVNRQGVLVSNKTIKGRDINEDGKVQQISSKDRYIFVGASRTVDMSIAVNSSRTVFIAKGGQGYNWLLSSAYPMLKSYLQQDSSCKVVFMMGNNDLQNISLYMEFYRKLIQKFSKVEFYFVDVTPGDGAPKNRSRQVFNAKMKAVFGERCIGGYNFLVNVGYGTVDGTHYKASTSRQLYNYICRKIKSLHITGEIIGSKEETTQPETTKPEIIQPETIQPETGTTQPETTEPETAQPETGTTQPETVQPE